MSFKSQAILDQAARVIQPIVEGLQAFFAGDRFTVLNNGSENFPSLSKLVNDARDAVAEIAPGALAAASAAAASAALAQTALQAALAAGLIYPTTAAGIAATGSTTNKFFWVTPSVDAGGAVDLYRNVSGVAALQSSIPNTALVALLATMLTTGGDADDAFTITDDDGFVAFGFDKTGAIRTPMGSLIPTAEGGLTAVDAQGYVTTLFDSLGFHLAGLILRPIGGGQVLLQDADGFTVSLLDRLLPRAALGADSVPLEVQRINQGNLADSARTKATIVSTGTRFTAQYNHILGFGQSFSMGNCAWPAISLNPRHGNLSLGDSDRTGGGESNANTSRYLPLGDDVLRPLVATNQSVFGYQNLAYLGPIADPATFGLNDAVGGSQGGETPMVGALNFAKFLWLRHINAEQDATRLFVATNSGVGGAPIAVLTKGFNDGLNNYNRVLEAADKVQAAVGGARLALAGILYLQGEADLSQSASFEYYKGALLAMRDNISADVATTRYGQSEKPNFYTYQTGAQYSASADPAVCRAQLALAREQPNWYLATPSYPFTDHLAHWDNNGARWAGKQIGKVIFKTLCLGQAWLPLHMREATLVGTRLLVGFYVPEPPLRFAKPWNGYAEYDSADKGFTVTDASGNVPIESVTIVADTVIQIGLGRTCAGIVKLAYADPSHGGLGCVQDSDSLVSDDVYTFSGPDVGGNLPQLVGKPYPLNNWCCTDVIDVQRLSS